MATVADMDLLHIPACLWLRLTDMAADTPSMNLVFGAETDGVIGAMGGTVARVGITASTEAMVGIMVSMAADAGSLADMVSVATGSVAVHSPVVEDLVVVTGLVAVADSHSMRLAAVDTVAVDLVDAAVADLADTVAAVDMVAADTAAAMGAADHCV
jgi:hypothetical protein